MGSTRRPRKKEHEWEEHKSTIEKLFLRDKKPLDGNDGIIHLMKTQHHFIASKSQFETRLRKWGFQKNLTKEEWVDAGRLINQRKDQGRESKLIFNGNVISISRVRKEMSRYHEEIGVAQSYPSLSTEASSRVTVRSPTPESSSAMLVPPDLALIDKRMTRLNGSPSRAETSSVPIGFLNDVNESSASQLRSITPDVVDTSNTSSVSSGYQPSYQVVEPLIQIIRNELPVDTFSLLENLSRTLLRVDISTASEVVSSIPAIDSSYISLLPSRLRVQMSSIPRVPAQLGIAVNHLINNDYKSSSFWFRYNSLTLHEPYDKSEPYDGSEPSSPNRNQSDGNARLVDWLFAYLKVDICSSMQYIQNCLDEPFRQRVMANLWAIANAKTDYSLMEASLSRITDVRNLHPQVDERLFREALALNEYRVADLMKRHIKTTSADDLNFVELLWKYISGFNSITIAELKNFAGHVSHMDLDLLIRALQLGEPQLVDLILWRAYPRTDTYKSWIREPKVRCLVTEHPDQHFAIRFFGIMIKYTPRCDLTLKHDAKSSWSSALSSAIRLDKDQLIQWLGERVPLDGEGLHILICRNKIDTLSFFLDRRMKFPAACLTLAVRIKSMQMVTFFITARIQPQSTHSLACPTDQFAIGFESYRPEDQGRFLTETKSCNGYINICNDRPVMCSCNTPHAEAFRVGFDAAIEIFERRISRPYTASHLLSLIFATAASGDTNSMSRYLWDFKQLIVQATGKFCYDGAMDFVLEVTIAHKNMDAACKLINTGMCSSKGVLRLLGQLVKRKEKTMIEKILERREDTALDERVLGQAIELGDSSFVNYLLPFAKESSISEVIKDAVCIGSLEIVEILLRRSVDCQVNSPLGFAPLSECCSQSTDEEDEYEPRYLLLEEVYYSYTSLTFAVYKGQLEMVSLLLDHGADPNFSTYDENVGHMVPTALQVAASREDSEMIQFLIARGADCKDAMALQELSAKKNILMIRELLDAFRMSTLKPRNPMFILDALKLAIGRDHMEVFEVLIDFAIRDLTGLQKDHVFVERAADRAIISSHSNSTDMLRILVAIVDDRKDFARYGEKTGSRLLFRALEFGSIDKINILLDSGFSVHETAETAQKRTPLQYAVGLGRLDIVSHLLMRGANVNAEPAVRFGATALQVAAIKGYVGIAELLILKGALVNAPACKIGGRTAFEGATEWGKFDMMLLLVRNGADLTSEFGENQFHRALEFARKNNKDPAVIFARQLYVKIKNIEMEVGMLSPLGVHDLSQIYPSGIE